MNMLLALALSLTAVADPCGMVPPIWLPEPTDGQAAITRQGDQITYAFFKDGIETMVLRPGFNGSVDEFGMLIPFPSPPTIRKTADDTFSHLGAAADPPKMTVEIIEPYIYENYDMSMDMSEVPSMAVADDFDGARSAPLRYDEVRVVNQEAVGMYEVAVLQAGSSRALNKWMTQHEFRYPDGMDEVIEDYVAEQWAFVAIKAKVGQMPGVAPRPGMRTVDSKLPKGASFDGHVQGMGFRFRTDKPVIPMRLAAFNDAAARNLVYFLAEDAVRIDGMPKGLVVRQIDGDTLTRNLTEPIPIQVINGSLTPQELAQFDGQRSPTPYNGIAKELFASDLLAVQQDKLVLPFEEYEKELLRVSESLALRGPAIDALHGVETEHKKGVALIKVVNQLDDMTLTVFDGDFDQNYMATRNISFASYDMPLARNTRNHWTRAPLGPYAYVEKGGGGWFDGGWIPDMLPGGW